MIPRASDQAERDFLAHGLTGREQDAARSVLAGMTAGDAAAEMGVGASTVGSFRQSAYRKLGVSGARELVARYGEKDAAPARDWRPVLLARGLSDTQADVLALVAEGLSSAEIAARLHLAAGTVSSARANGYRMLGVHSREGLVEALEAGEAAELERAEAPRRRRAGRLAAACVAAVVLLAALIAGGQAVANARPDAVETAYGEMPNVVGLSAQEAWDALADAGFYPTLVAAGEDGEPGTVTEVTTGRMTYDSVSDVLDPEGHVHSEYNRTEWRAQAFLHVSGMAQMPPQITLGHTEADARSELTDLGFTNLVVEHEGVVDPHNNRVVECSVPSGAWVLLDDPITLTVTSDVEIPNVFGMTPVDATAAIYHAGLVPDPYVNEWSYYSDKEVPVAVYTEPEFPGTARVGDVIHVVYSVPVEPTGSLPTGEQRGGASNPLGDGGATI